jgi:hypothetical protein
MRLPDQSEEQDEAASADEPLFPLQASIEAIGGNPVVVSQWLGRYEWLRDLPPEALDRPGQGGRPIRAQLWLISTLCIAVELVRCGVRADKALRAGYYFCNVGKAVRLSPGADPGEARIPDEANRLPGKLFAGPVGTWLVYAGPNDLVVLADPHRKPLRLGRAFEAADRAGRAGLTSTRIIVDVDDLFQRISRALDLDFNATFKTRSHFAPES